jgi:hypothetical protein
MLCGKRIAVVMPAYNAAKTLEKTVREERRQQISGPELLENCKRAILEALGLC